MMHRQGGGAAKPGTGGQREVGPAGALGPGVRRGGEVGDKACPSLGVSTGMRVLSWGDAWLSPLLRKWSGHHREGLAYSQAFPTAQETGPIVQAHWRSAQVLVQLD